MLFFDANFSFALPTFRKRNIMLKLFQCKAIFFLRAHRTTLANFALIIIPNCYFSHITSRP